jgi:hypothetical protein
MGRPTPSETGTSCSNPNLGAQGPVQVPARPVQERLHLGRGQAGDEAQVHVVPGVQFEGLDLVGGHARDRFPGHQPRIGVIGVREGRRFVGIAGRNRLAPKTFRTGQRVERQAEPFIANQAPICAVATTSASHRDLRVSRFWSRRQQQQLNCWSP